VDGRDRASFLHALLSNDIAALAPGRGCYATYLTPQGRMIADMHVYDSGDHLLLDVEPGIAASLTSTLDRLIFSEDAAVTDVSARVSSIGVIGNRAGDVIAAAFTFDRGALARMTAGDVLDVSGTDGMLVAKTARALEPSFDVFVPSERSRDVRAKLESAGAEPIAEDMVEALRIDAAHPRFGVDMTTDTIPLEAGLLERAISQTKGCYVGQEVIVRVLHRGGGRVARLLVKIERDVLAGSMTGGSVISIDGRETGQITSAAISPASGRAIALGYVKRDDAAVGRVVDVGGVSATIAAFAN